MNGTLDPLRLLASCAFAGALAFAQSGCATLRGAPAPVIEKQAIDQMAAQNAQSAYEALGASKTAEERNTAALKLLAISDITYLRFKTGLIANRRNVGAASNAITLAADIAATLTDSVGVKDNYIALSALMQGGEAIYDKEYLFEKTLDALITQMDANRKKKLADVYRAMGRSLEAYPWQMALSDVLEYHQAGSLGAALIGIQGAAEQQDTEATLELRELRDLPLPEIKKLQSETDRVGRLYDSLSPLDRIKLEAFLISQGVPVPPHSSPEGERKALMYGLYIFRRSKSSTFEDFVARMTEAGFVVPE